MGLKALREMDVSWSKTGVEEIKYMDRNNCWEI